jgi:hypothetical protein
MSLGYYVIYLVIVLPFLIPGMMLQNGGEIIPTSPAQFNLAGQIEGSLLSWVGYIVAFPLTIGLAYAALKQLRGEEFGFSDLFAGFRRFFPLLGVGLLTYIAVTISAMLCIVPVFYVAGAVSLAGLLSLDRGMGAIEALQTSMRTLGSSSWLMTIFLLVAAIFSSLGAIACGIGVIVTMPLIYIGLALHYNYFFPSATAQEGYVLPQYP